MHYLYFDLRLFTKLVSTFIIMTVVGSLSHEYGHYVAAKYYGLKPTINYASTKYNRPPDHYKETNEIGIRNLESIRNKRDFAEKER